MKRRYQITIPLVVGTLCWVVAAQTPRPDANIQGTWELVAQGIGNGQTSNPLASSKQKEIKLIVDGHFVWTTYDLKHRTPDAIGGGTYHMMGDSYVEHLDFASSKLSSFVGHDQKFTIKVAADELVQTGVLSDGTKLQETWERVH